MVRTYVRCVTVAALTLLSPRIFSEEQGSMPPRAENPVEYMDVIQNPDDPGESAIVLTVCGGKHIVMKVPTTDLRDKQDEILQLLMAKVKQVCRITASE